MQQSRESLEGYPGTSSYVSIGELGRYIHEVDADIGSFVRAIQAAGDITLTAMLNDIDQTTEEQWQAQKRASGRT